MRKLQRYEESAVQRIFCICEKCRKNFHHSHSSSFDRIKKENFHKTRKHLRNLSSSSCHWPSISSCLVTEGKTVYPAPQRHTMLQFQGNLGLGNQWEWERSTFRIAGVLMILLQPKDTTITVIFTQDWGLQLLPWAHPWDTSRGLSAPDKPRWHRRAVAERKAGQPLCWGEREVCLVPCLW